MLREVIRSERTQHINNHAHLQNVAKKALRDELGRRVGNLYFEADFIETGLGLAPVRLR